MPARPKPRRRVGAAAVIKEHPERRPDEGLVQRPDGWYGMSPDGHQQFGPFESAEVARADRDRDEDSSIAPSAAEAEDDIGINTWIDPETGEPAEGTTTRRLDNE